MTDELPVDGSVNDDGTVNVRLRLPTVTQKWLEAVSKMANVTVEQAINVFMAAAVVRDMPTVRTDVVPRPHPETGELAAPGNEWVVDHDRSMGDNILYKQVPAYRAADITGRCQRHVQADPNCDACNGWPAT